MYTNKVQLVTGMRPMGFRSALSISSSIFDSVLSASLPNAFNITEITKPLNKNAIKNN